MKKAYKFIKPYVVITFGLLLYVTAWTTFLIPSGITGGGVSGIGALVYFATGIPVGLTYFIINIFLVGLAIKILGANFGVKTIFGIIMASILFSVLQKLITRPLLEDKFMSAIIGGMLSGVGIGITFTQGGSSGGTDIIAMIVGKYRNISPGRIILFCDVFIIASAFVVMLDKTPIERLQIIVYGYVAMAITAYAIDAVLSGSRQSVQVFVFSKSYGDIADRVTKELGRGVTVIDGEGWYSKERQKVLITMVRKHELSDVYRIVKEIDNDAFISVSLVMGVYGKGFERIRA
ncbi:MAG TPA: YitT family protein [Williamwhitmania sp.]|nr:YitT family protein [Williamwhitmania sp.]